MSLYTKYRPRDWDSVIGQDAISTILRTSLEQDRVSHAYLFTGSRGTGKTTSARILAKGVNCKSLQQGNPCHLCEHCVAFDNGTMLDVIEIDGASNNGVENVRELIEKARFEPNQGRYKIYIIDEVHMLSGGAFNALLKTLEEPPSHVKFILATTEIAKIPETIRSRSLRFDFRKIGVEDIIKRLEYVIRTEGIQAEPRALEIIARAARGGLRDALTLTEQTTINGQISTEYVESTLSLIDDAMIQEILDALISGDHTLLLSLIETLQSRHIDVRGFFDQVMYSLRDRMRESFVGGDHEQFGRQDTVFKVFESAYPQIRMIPDGMLVVEMTLMRAVQGEIRGDQKTEAVHPVKKPDTPSVKKIEEKSQEKIVPSSESNKVQDPETSSGGPDNREDLSSAGQSSFSFITLLAAVKESKPALVTDLKTSRFEVDESSEPKKLKLLFSKEWNYNRVNTATIKNTLVEVLERVCGGSWEVSCELSPASSGDVSEGIF